MVRPVQDEIAKRRRSNQPVDVLLAEVLKKETFNKEMRVSIEMYLSWFKDPVTAASHKRIFVFDIVNQRVIFRNERPKGQPILTGGCALRLVDKRAEEEQGLVQLWQESQTKMQNAVPERLVQVEGGVLFKLGFEDLSLVDEEERAGASGLFASKAGRSLTEREIKAFQAVERSDKDAFAQTVLENWDVKNARGVALVHYITL